MSYLISLGAGLVVGFLYYFSRVQSPAPPLIALAGLLGIVIGEHAIPFVQAQLKPAVAQSQTQTAPHEVNPTTTVAAAQPSCSNEP
jgi:XapX domain-containing protein